MKKFFAIAVVLLGAVLVACDKPTKPPVPEVDFATDQSVLRGSWVAPLEGFPSNSQLFLTDIVATCETVNEDVCELYTFAGSLRVDKGEDITFEGEGDSGGTRIYTLTSPIIIPEPSARATFSLNGADWIFWVEYRRYRYSALDLGPGFEGYICKDEGQEAGSGCLGTDYRAIYLEPVR